MSDTYLTITPFGLVDAVFREDSNEFTGPEDAVAYLREVAAGCTGANGIGISLDSVEPRDYLGFCAPKGKGITIIPPADVLLDAAEEKDEAEDDDEGEDFDPEAEFEATPEKEDEEVVMDGDFKGHPFRGNQYRKASEQSGSAVRASIKAKAAERKGDHKAAAKSHRAAHYSHMAAAEEATGKARKYHKTMARFHGKRAGVRHDSVEVKLDAAGDAAALREQARTAAGAIAKLAAAKALMAARVEPDPGVEAWAAANESQRAQALAASVPLKYGTPATGKDNAKARALAGKTWADVPEEDRAALMPYLRLYVRGRKPTPPVQPTPLPPPPPPADPELTGAEEVIGGVKFIAVRRDLPRPHWTAQVAETGEDLPQTYATKPAMWADLQRSARAMGDRWASQFIKTVDPRAREAEDLKAALAALVELGWTAGPYEGTVSRQYDWIGPGGTMITPKGTRRIIVGKKGAFLAATLGDDTVASEMLPLGQKHAEAAATKLHMAVEKWAIDTAARNPSNPDRIKKGSTSARALQGSNDMLTIKDFMPLAQRKAIVAGMKGEEADYFIDKMAEMRKVIETMPVTYQQDGKGRQAVAHLHYFKGGADWYITEKDKDGGVDQAFGLADLFGDGGEMGYISIREVTEAGAELDLHWAPKTIAEISGKTDPEPDPMPEPQPEPAGPKFRYALVNRPADLGTVPKGLAYTVEPRPAKGQPHWDMARHGILVADRELTAEEVKAFELAPLVDGADLGALADAIANAMSEYANQYVAMAKDDAEAFAGTVRDTLKSASSGITYSVGDMGLLVQMVRDKLGAMAGGTPEPQPDPTPPPTDTTADDMALLRTVANGTHPQMLDPELADQIEAVLLRHPDDKTIQELGERAILAYSNGLMAATGG